jgi:hypothetical protein
MDGGNGRNDVEYLHVAAAIYAISLPTIRRNRPESHQISRNPKTGLAIGSAECTTGIVAASCAYISCMNAIGRHVCARSSFNQHRNERGCVGTDAPKRR